MTRKKKNNSGRPSLWRNPETGEVWRLGRRYVPDGWERVEEGEEPRD